MNHGDHFIAISDGRHLPVGVIIGKIHIEKGHLFLLQSVYDGITPTNIDLTKTNFACSWSLHKYVVEDYIKFVFKTFIILKTN